MPEYGKLYEIYIRAYRSTWMERGPGRGMGRELLVGGGWRYCRVSAAEPIKTSTAHYFACFSFDNNAGSDPNRIKKKEKKREADSKASSELVLSSDSCRKEAGQQFTCDAKVQ